MQEAAVRLERPFEKQVGQVCLLKCAIKQNYKDGVKSVDYQV